MELSVLIGHIPHRAARRRRSPSRATPRSACSSTTASATGAPFSPTSAWRTWRRAAAHRLPLDARDPRCRARHPGPAGRPDPPEAPRTGAPVETFSFPARGRRRLPGRGAARARRPRAARDRRPAGPPPRAGRSLLRGLRRAEVPSLRRVRAQDFAFRPGVEVTDVRQVKGLEFDYVVMLDANDSSYGRDDESRHCSTSASPAPPGSSGSWSPARPARWCPAASATRYPWARAGPPPQAPGPGPAPASSGVLRVSGVFRASVFPGWSEARRSVEFFGERSAAAAVAIAAPGPPRLRGGGGGALIRLEKTADRSQVAASFGRIESNRSSATTGPARSRPPAQGPTAPS